MNNAKKPYEAATAEIIRLAQPDFLTASDGIDLPDVPLN